MKEPITVIGYARLSDQKQLQGGGGQNQIDAIRDYVEKNGFVLYKDKVFEEVYTGTGSSSDRPVYKYLLQEIVKNKDKIKYFVIKKIDRGSRSGSGEFGSMKTLLGSLGVEIRDTEGVMQPIQNRLAHRKVGYEWSNTSSSHMTEVILAEMASEDRKNILTRTIDTSINRIETGYKLRESNYGYENKKTLGEDGQYKYIQIPFEPEVSFMRTIFNDSAEGLMSDLEIVNKINSLGCRSRSRNIYNKERNRVIGRSEGNKISVKQMQKWRQNPIYCGVIKESWGDTQKRVITSKAQYDGLVTVGLFNRANKGKVFVDISKEGDIKILYDLKSDKVIKKRLKFREDFLFKNVVLCPLCKSPFKGSGSKSRSNKHVPYYHCSRNHKYFGIPKKEFEDAVNSFISDITFSETYYNKLEKFLISEFKNKIKEIDSGETVLDERVTVAKQELRELYDSIKRSKSPSVLEELEREYESKSVEVICLENEKRSMSVTEEDISVFLNISKSIVEHPKDILTDVHSFEQQIAVNSLFFEGLPTYDEILSGTPKLSLFFKVMSSKNSEEAVNVTLRGVEPRFYP